MKKVIDGDRDKGIVFYHLSTGGVVRTYDRKKGDILLVVSDSASSSGLDFDFSSKLLDTSASA